MHLARGRWLWWALAALAAGIVVLSGAWIALRVWPEQVGRRLHPGLAIDVALLGAVEQRAAVACLAACGEAGRHADVEGVLGGALTRGSPRRQRAALDLLSQLQDSWPGRMLEPDGVFALVGASDEDVDLLARRAWFRGRDTALRWLVADAASPSDEAAAFVPGGWSPGAQARIAFDLLLFLGGGYDQRMPSRYREHVRWQLARLQAAVDADGRSSADPCDQALVALALAEAFGMSNEQALKPAVERAGAVVAADLARLGDPWTRDTAHALFATMCGKALLSAGLATTLPLGPLAQGYDAWVLSRPADGPPAWHAGGAPVADASLAERWAVALVAGVYLARRDAHARCTPGLLADAPGASAFSRYLTTYAAFLGPQAAWRPLVASRRTRLLRGQLATADHGGVEGSWPARPASPARWETLFASMQLQFHYRHSVLPSPP